jgi:hypothetical protein
VLSGLGVAPDGALLFSSGQAAHAACGGTLFALWAAGLSRPAQPAGRAWRHWTISTGAR